MAVPVGFTVQSTVEAPGTFPGGNGQVEIQVGEVSTILTVHDNIPYSWGGKWGQIEW